MNKNFIQLLDRINKIRKLYGEEEIEFTTEPEKANMKDLEAQKEEQEKLENKKELINERIKNRHEVDIDEFKFALFTMKTVEFLPFEELIDYENGKLKEDCSKDVYLTIFNIYHSKEDENGTLTNNIEDLIVEKKYTLEEANEEYNRLKERIFTEDNKNTILENVNKILDEQIDRLTLL